MFKKYNNKKRRIIGFSIIAATAAFGVTSTALTIPGVGLQSLKLINSVEKQIKKIMPKGTFVVNPQSPLYSMVMDSVIKKSYVADALSTVNWMNEEEKNTLVDAYTDFANQWYDDHWAAKVEAKEEIDLHDVGLNFIEFDEAIAQKYHSYGFVNTGIQWMFHKNGTTEIFAEETYEIGLYQQTILNQDVYESYLQYEGPGITGLVVNSSIGSYLVNNKVWFLNQQIISLSNATAPSAISPSLSPFKDSAKALEQAQKNAQTPVTVDDLYHPNFIAALGLMKFAYVLFYFNIAIIPAGAVFSYLALKNTVTEKKTKTKKEKTLKPENKGGEK
ncbi:hypothetical protein [Spiroplasma culicicola]|uniref:Transmembrane protein n=1 Tax=Spiroplasma culicicola AES-1 TaxID=1276246 RepID=W6A727_9MOLU|nr:hypothetical protein [Spiroplasma culicicola]AHI52943.1 hypothetical protein SCULI_v1c06020 [Spiroplasma culicicola AES-1]